MSNQSESTVAEAPLDERIMRASLDSYRSPDQRAAMRGALRDAAHLCDALATAAGDGRRMSAKLRDIQSAMKRCGDAIWAMREKIPVRIEEGEMRFGR